MLVYYVQIMTYRGDSASEAESEEEGVDEQEGGRQLLEGKHKCVCVCVCVQGQQCYLISGNGCATPEAALRWCNDATDIETLKSRAIQAKSGLDLDFINCGCQLSVQDIPETLTDWR